MSGGEINKNVDLNTDNRFYVAVIKINERKSCETMR